MMRLEETLAQENISCIEQGIQLIRRLDDAVYAGPSGDPGRGSVGQHFRHCIDFYDCLITGIGSGQIDYDRRRRDRELETARASALRALERIALSLTRLGTTEAKASLQVRLDHPGQAESLWSSSSLARELQFLLSHTVHHYALIAALVKTQGVEPDEGFGVAPSTLRHRSRTASAP